jgi:multiple antibiotic resistance protein
MEPSLQKFALLCFSSLLAIINPLSAAPMYLALTEGYTPTHRARTLRTALLTALLVMLTFAMLGGAIFTFFGITIDAFRIAGGFIFFGIGMDMLQAKRQAGKATEEEEEEGRVRENVGVTPLGIPMITGPGAITTVMVLMTQAATRQRVLIVLGSVVLVLAISWAVLSAAPRLVRFFGKTGMNVMTRLMGLLVTVVAVQFIVDGARPILTEILREALRP